MTTQSASQGLLQVRPYAAEGGYDSAGVVMMTLGMLAVAIAAGFVAHFVSQWIYLIVLFPAGVGLAVGATGAALAKRFKMRSPLLGGGVGLLCGIAAMLCMHWFDYSSFRADLEAAPAEAKMLFQLPDDEFNEAIADAPAEDQKNMRLVRQAMQADTFAGFMDVQAKQGVQLTSVGSSARGGMNLGYVGSYIYWLIEIGVVGIVSWFLVKTAASSPFCRGCNEWRKPRTLGFVRADPLSAVAHLATGGVGALPSLVTRDAFTDIAVQAYVCPQCQAEGAVDVKVEQTIHTKKNKTQKKVLAFLTYPAGSLGNLESAFASSQAEAGNPDDAAASALESMGNG